VRGSRGGRRTGAGLDDLRLRRRDRAPARARGARSVERSRPAPGRYTGRAARLARSQRPGLPEPARSPRHGGGLDRKIQVGHAGGAAKRRAAQRTGQKGGAPKGPRR
jgi:hypothetical protein